MLRMCSHIQIKKKDPAGAIQSYELDFVDHVEVISSWETLCDTATITLPKKVYVNTNGTAYRVSWENLALAFTASAGNKQDNGKAIFAVGDSIKIELGYDNNYNTVFEGYISDVASTVPIVLKCHDVLWVFDKINVSAHDFKKEEVKLSDVIAHLQSKITDSGSEFTKEKKYQFQAIPAGFDLGMDKYTIPNKSVYEILQELKSVYEIEIFHKDNVIYYGEAYGANAVGTSITAGIGGVKGLVNQYTGKSKLFGFQYNIIREEELISKKADDTRVKIQAISTPTSGTRGETQIVEADNIEKAVKTIKYEELALDTPRTTDKIIKIFKTNLSIEALGDLAKRRLRKIRYDGFSGSILAFGVPFVRHSDEVEIKDNILTDREGIYKVKRVVYTFGSGGYRQKIDLHYKVQKS